MNLITNAIGTFIVMTSQLELLKVALYWLILVESALWFTVVWGRIN